MGDHARNATMTMCAESPTTWAAVPSRVCSRPSPMMSRPGEVRNCPAAGAMLHPRSCRPETVTERGRNPTRSRNRRRSEPLKIPCFWAISPAPAMAGPGSRPCSVSRPAPDHAGPMPTTITALILVNTAFPDRRGKARGRRGRRARPQSATVVWTRRAARADRKVEQPRSQTLQNIGISRRSGDATFENVGASSLRQAFVRRSAASWRAFAFCSRVIAPGWSTPGHGVSSSRRRASERACTA